MNHKVGKFIVIDGTDGSGKSTQTKLLVEKLRENFFDVEMADFPQYGQKSAGLVEDYLNGKYGEAKEVGPYRASIFYACDRYDASFKIKKWLDQGKIVVTNRYVTANMGHQGGKIKDEIERKKYLDWLYELEYGLFGIPRPDLNIILHVDAAVALKLADARHAQNNAANTKRDIHESDINHLRDAERVYLEIANSYPDFKLLECTRGNEIMPIEEIHQAVWNEVMKLVHPASITRPVGDNNHNNSEFILKVEKLSPFAKLPTRAHNTDAGLDLYASDYYTVMPGERMKICNGIKIAIPDGYVGLIWDKGGISTKNGIHTIAGVIDAGYRGELAVSIINLSGDIYNISPGQKIAQMLIQKIEQPEIVETVLKDETERGENGYGSSGIF